jgi:hypothetical protein
MLVPLLALGALIAPSAVAAAPQTEPGHLGFATELSWEAGGDRVGTVYFTDGSTRPIFAGDGWSAAVGAHYRLADSPLDFCALTGLKYLSVSGSNGNIKLTRELVEVRADYFVTHGIWIGAGPVWHTGIKVDADGFGDNLKFSNALGATAKVGWRCLALTATSMRYKDDFGYHYSANSLGVTLMGRF